MENTMPFRLISLFTVVAFLSAAACPSSGDESGKAIYPKVAPAFGKIVTVKGQIRLVGEPTPAPKDWKDFCEIKVFSVEGKKLSTPVTVECGVFSASIGDKVHFDRFKRNNFSKPLSVTGYESVRTEGLPDGLGKVVPGEVPQGRGWHVQRTFIILKIEALTDRKEIPKNQR
jgi:hypothetical protein